LRENPQPRRGIQHLHRADIENIRLVRSMNQLQVLRDKLNIDNAAGGILDIPDITLALFFGDGTAHFENIVGDNAGLTPARQHFANDGFNPFLERG
jgi:hypothetical protein